MSNPFLFSDTLDDTRHLALNPTACGGYFLPPVLQTKFADSDMLRFLAELEDFTKKTLNMI